MKTGYHYNFSFRRNKWEVQGLVSRTERTENLMDIMRRSSEVSKLCGIGTPSREKMLNLNPKDVRSR